MKLSKRQKGLFVGLLGIFLIAATYGTTKYLEFKSIQRFIEEGITEDDIDLCTRDLDCVAIPYTSCSCASMRAINKQYEALYLSQLDWQRNADSEGHCASLGACLGRFRRNVDTVCKPSGRCSLGSHIPPEERSLSDRALKFLWQLKYGELF